jgi:hypothetical protein
MYQFWFNAPTAEIICYFAGKCVKSPPLICVRSKSYVNILRNALVTFRKTIQDHLIWSATDIRSIDMFALVYYTAWRCIGVDIHIVSTTK